MDDLLQKLDQWGCDSRAVLWNMMGDKDFYRHLLKQFLEDPSVQELNEAIAGGDTAGAVQALHELKGTTATLGLTPLNHEISLLLDDIRDGNVEPDKLRDRCRPMERELSTCYAIIGLVSENE